MFSVEGKKAIITGGANGIGRSLVQGFQKSGVEVALLDKDDEIFSLADELSGTTKVHPIKVDLLNMEDLHEGFQSALDLLNGKVDILINSAGLIKRHPAEEFPNDMWEKILELNLIAVFELSRLTAKIMKEQGGGKIINFGSIVSVIGAYHSSAYSASKGAVLQLTKSLSNEWAEYGIQVNALAPGYMLTAMNNDLIHDSLRRGQVEDRIPAKRWGETEDVLGPALFLASEASNYVTGTLIPIDGGVLGR